MTIANRSASVATPGPSLVSQLARLCADHPTTEKTVVVPSLAAGHQLGDRLARVRPWINLRFETVRSLVDGVVALDIAADGLTLLSRAQSLALVEQACLETLTPSSYFGAIADRPGLHRAIQSTLDDLRHAGVSPADFPEHFEDRRKGEELQAILGRYQSLLDEHRFIDRSGALHRALESLRATPPEPRTPCLAVVETVELSAAEDELLHLVAGGSYITLRVGAPSPPPEYDFFQAAGEENEVREVLRRIVGRGIAFDDAEIVYSMTEGYLPLVHELTAGLEIPCSFAEGVPAMTTAPGQAALGFLRWVESDFQSSRLRALCLSGAIELMWSAQAKLAPFLAEAKLRRSSANRSSNGAEAAASAEEERKLALAHSTHDLTPSALARVLRDATIGWGRERYAKCIDGLLQQLTERLDRSEDDLERARLTSRMERARAAAEIVAGWLSLVPLPVDGDRVDLGALAKAARLFVERNARIHSPLDAAAKPAICRMLAELEELPPSSGPIATSATRLADAVVSLLVGGEPPRPGRLHASPVTMGGWSGRRHVFFVGLDDARVPGAGLQDPVLLDAERSRINEAIDPRRMSLYGDATTRRTELYARCIALAASERDGARLTFSYSSRDLLEAREQFPAAVILDAFRLGRGDAAAGYRALREATAAAEASFIPRDTAIDLDEWWLAQIDGADADAIKGALRAEFPWLAQGSDAEAARATDKLTVYDGLVGDTSAVDPRTTGRAVSSTELEKLASCPFAWFLGSALGIEPFEEERRDPAQWLDPMQLGILVHGILEQFVREVIARGKAIDPKRDRARLVEIAEAAVAALRDDVPPASETSYEATRADVLRGCEIFLGREKERGAVTPVAVEASFGMPSGSPSPLDLDEPIAIPLGRGKVLRVKGRIDRVDRAGAKHHYEIWDYKSGSTWGFGERGSLHRGTKLQHAIYAVAVEEMLRRSGVKTARVTKSGYYFPMEKGGGRLIAKHAEEGKLEEALGHILTFIEDGLFPHGTEDACRYCDFKPVCGDPTEAAARFARKAAASPTRKAVKAWQALQEVE